MIESINFNEDLFALQAHEYIRDINPAQQYFEQQAHFLSIMRQIPVEEAMAFVRKVTAKDGQHPMVNPRVTCIKPDENGDRQKVETTFLQYFRETIANKEILTGPMATFMDQRKKMAYLSLYVSQAFPKRAAMKKLQFQKKQEGDPVGEAYGNNAQNNIKRSINAISGGSSIPTTPIYCASLHPVLTSHCRMTSGYANANNEKLLGGNRHYHSAEVTLNNLVALSSRIDEENIMRVVKQYNLYIPTDAELFEDVLRCSRQYWHWREKEVVIREFLSKCNPAQRASIAYTYDMYLLRKYNPDFAMDFIASIGQDAKPIEGMSMEEAKDIFNKAKESIRVIGLMIHGDRTAGKKKEQYTADETVLYLAASIVQIYRTLDQYRDFITTFLRSKHVPASLAKLPNALRHIVLMSDTDSSMFTLQDWTGWVAKEKNDYSERTNRGIFGAMLFLVDATLKHLLANMSANIGISEENIFETAMKNEFSFRKMVPLGRTKHYVASIDCQEGNVYTEMDIEKKGVHLKNSNSPKEIIDHAESIMVRAFNLDTNEPRPVYITELMREIADEERKILTEVNNGGSTYYRSKQIKNAEAYKLEADNSPYANYIFWNETFGEFYGKTPPPPYSAFDVKLTIGNKSQWDEFLDSIENKELVRLIQENLKRRNKGFLATINIPSELFIGRPIPKELIPYVAKRDLILNICAPYYIAMEGSGVFMMDKDSSKLFSDYY